MIKKGAKKIGGDIRCSFLSSGGLRETLLTGMRGSEKSLREECELFLTMQMR